MEYNETKLTELYKEIVEKKIKKLKITASWMIGFGIALVDAFFKMPYDTLNKSELKTWIFIIAIAGIVFYFIFEAFNIFVIKPYRLKLESGYNKWANDFLDRQLKMESINKNAK